MCENSCRLLGFYDELLAFLTQINLCRGHQLSDSHEIALFLQLYNGHPWRRDTGSYVAVKQNWYKAEIELYVNVHVVAMRV